ncbi:GyrI-like domain-containing protein [Leucobacter luti]|uniref:Effector-binding domain-containing protein n=1 Tax=Leucobacter luti TaxID=340320 RepID=A0A4R6RZV2_9MICO|nr:GyrI-like domain-containing protein [Leucobacter luti]MCW2287795.1 effector-binding domain-containing protein [Leucobacter luti]QYM76202.1 GyrI-like domain-containing protein [Leucobacter luti]TCK46042.1 effector-binding domain-containing protein [Leucobacter luti]TDP92464.1 effector-binding domain-containing protein [Leucobacter luti]
MSIDTPASDSPEFPAPELVEQPEIHLAVVRDTVAFDAIPSLYDRAYPLIFAALGSAGIQPSAPPMGVIHGAPGDTLDLSVAVPIAAPIAATGEVHGETLPASRAATLLVRGDYALLGSAYGYLYGWIAEQGHDVSGIAWEQYLTEPVPGGDPALNETLLAVYLA